MPTLLLSHLPGAQGAAPQPSVKGALWEGLIIIDASCVWRRQPNPLDGWGLAQTQPRSPHGEAPRALNPIGLASDPALPLYAERLLHFPSSLSLSALIRQVGIVGEPTSGSRVRVR